LLATRLLICEGFTENRQALSPFAEALKPEDERIGVKGRDR
jgi:hypothetical protein